MKRDRSAYQFKSMGMGLKTAHSNANLEEFHFIDGVDDSSDKNVRMTYHQLTPNI